MEVVMGREGGRGGEFTRGGTMLVVGYRLLLFSLDEVMLNVLRFQLTY